MIYLLNGIPFDITIEHKIGEVNYPKGWFLDAGNRLTIGIVETPSPVAPIPTAAELFLAAKVSLTLQVQAHLDNTAASRGYDDVVSACSYAGAVNPFQAEGIQFVTWRGNVWATCYTLLAEVQAGTRPIPTVAELLLLLPVLL